MQPDSNGTSQQDSLTTDSSDTEPSSQHGHSTDRSDPSLPPRSGEGRNSRRPSAVSRQGSDTSSQSSDSISGRASRRVDASSRAGKNSKDRVSEYERAATRSAWKKKALGPAFTIVERKRDDRRHGAGLDEFPNEVLIHILSHLPPVSLATCALVSRRFHHLVTTPHAWRSAFSRYFPGPDALNVSDSGSEDSTGSGDVRAEKRCFSRLTPRASWRSEYVLRTRLLHSLTRGRPVDDAPHDKLERVRQPWNPLPAAQVTYDSNQLSAITQLHATFSSRSSTKSSRVIHGTSELGTASISNPRTGRIENWSHHGFIGFHQFADVFPGAASYGQGSGETIGVPNVMDVSQPYGVIYGEGHELDSVLWYHHSEEKNGRALLRTTCIRDLALGIPLVRRDDAICSVWIAKGPAVPNLTRGLVGILAGSSRGILTAYSVGTSGSRQQRFTRGETTARWVLNPGVPITSIVVDENASNERISARRSWAVVLNALGETFYIDALPSRPDADFPENRSRGQLTDPELEKLAWITGKSVQWHLIEPTRRSARPHNLDDGQVDGSYSPQLSWEGARLGPAQVAAETQEVEVFLQKKAKDFRRTCFGWDMRRRLEVDFANSKSDHAGEAVFIISRAFEENVPQEVRRYTRYQIRTDASTPQGFDNSTAPNGELTDFKSIPVRGASLFGGDPGKTAVVEPPSAGDSRSPTLPRPTVDEWRSSKLSFGDIRIAQITTSAIDCSAFAKITTGEDPLVTSSAKLSDQIDDVSEPRAGRRLSIGAVPGQRGRLLAIGTSIGTILLYNARGSNPPNVFLESSLRPVRIIATNSPQITCLALTALYLVHGGNDGLVQAWDPLASTSEPLRTINSRFSSRARRRLVQAEASVAGVGVNFFAAGAICLDPDPTQLRGIVSLGSHLRFWHYSSESADQYKGSKRRLRRPNRGSNQAAEGFTSSGRGALKEYIANERIELERERRAKEKEEQRLVGRFGIDLLGPGATEDEILAYATMLSQEAAQTDEARRQQSASPNERAAESALASPSSSAVPQPDNDSLAEAVRLSLQDSDMSSPDVAIRYVKGRSPRSASSPLSAPVPELEELDYALQLSLAEEQSKSESPRGKQRAS